MPPITRTTTERPSQTKVQNMWKSGNLLIYLGWTGIALLVIDRYLQYAEHQEAQQMMDVISDETKQKRMQLLEEWRDKPTKFKCKVHEEYKMGGSHGLEGVFKNDTIEVLQEAVGPGGYYNLCRTREQDGTVKSVGWYPIGYLTKI